MADSSPPPSSQIKMTVCSARRVSSADGASRIPPLATQEHARHRPSSYHHDSRQSGSGDKFYSLHSLPPLEVVSKCISGFIRGTSTLFFVLPEYETIELMNAIYHPGTGQSIATNSKLCELLSIAAIGSQYEEVGQELQMALFRSAKWYLDSGFGKDDDILKKMRTSMLVGLYFVFEKSFWGRDYLDQAIELACSRGLNGMQRHSSYSEREWASWKRVWGTLVFLDGWLSGSLGSMPTICEGNDPIYTQGYRTCMNDLDAYLHAELIKISILSGNITKDVYTPTVIDFKKVEMYSVRLKSWHSSLPESLRLHRAVSGNDSRQRSTILLAHCTYLSCIILLTRRIFVERLEGGSEGLDGLARMAIADEYAQMCVSAGRQLATVVGLLHSEGRIVRRCWILIQAAYNAGLIVLLCLSARGSSGSNTDPSDVHDQALISKCLGALEVCVVYDLVAQRFFDVLSSIHRSLPVSTSSVQQRIRADSEQSLGNVSPTDEKLYLPRFCTSNQLTKHILDIFRQPFGGESKVIGKNDYVLSRFFPDNWRFLVPEPPPVTGCESISHVTTPDSTSGGSSDGSKQGSRKRRLPAFQTKEEYEAFFRRVS